MKIAVLAVAGVLVLGGGGAGAWFFMGKKAEAAVGETTEHADPADAKHAKKDEKGGEHGEGHAPEATFVQLDPLILPIIDENGISQTVSLVIALEVTDDPTGEEVRSLSPRLKDAYIQDMYGVLNKQSAMQGGIIQVNMIKERLNTVTRKVLGEDKVKDVLLQVVQQRPI